MRYRVDVLIAPASIETHGVERLKRGYSVEGKIIVHSDRIINIVLDYLFQKVAR